MQNINFASKNHPVEQKFDVVCKNDELRMNALHVFQIFHTGESLICMTEMSYEQKAFSITSNFKTSSVYPGPGAHSGASKTKQ